METMAARSNMPIPGCSRVKEVATRKARSLAIPSAASGRSWVEDRWWLKTPGHYVYTLVHIADDDPAPSPGSLGGLEGWWKLEYSGVTEYYLVHSNGTVRYTKTAPHPGQRWMGHAEESAYWFMASNGTITFIWRDTGTVEVWKPECSGYKSVVNGITPGKLTKLP